MGSPRWEGLVSGYGRLLGQSLEPNENNRPAALFTTIRPLVQRPFIPLRFGDTTRILKPDDHRPKN